MYQYWAFGLHINSELPFPEFLATAFTSPDVVITVGKAPECLEGEDVMAFPKLSASPTQYLVTIDNVAKYHVSGGKTITIEPCAGADDNSIRLFLLSNAMAALLHQQHKIPMHASGIITPNGLVLFTGLSGAGKSTTALALIQRGYDIFTDDVCVLGCNETNGAVEAVASYPMMKLWEQTVDNMQLDQAKQHRLRPGLDKYGIFQHDTFFTGKLPISKIFVLETDSDAPGFSCKKIKDLEAFDLLQQNTYRRSYVNLMKLEQHHFTMMTHLTRQTDVYKLVRPKTSGDIPAFIDFLQQYI